VPLIDSVKGTKIYVYPNDHVPPHVHGIYAEHEAVIAIATLNLLNGFLPKTQLYAVLNYVQENESELLELFYQLNPATQKR
jgi:Domain of unknown function (DUF4160)